MSLPSSSKSALGNSVHLSEMNGHAGAESTSTISPHLTPQKQLEPNDMQTDAPLPPPAASTMTPALTDKRGAVLPEMFSSMEDEDKDALPRSKKTPLFSAACLKAATPILLTASLYGYNIGLVGPYATVYSYATNCQLYGAQTSCETLSGAKCQWMNARSVDPTSTLGNVCGWQAPTTTCFLKYSDEAGCGSDSDCVWNYSGNTCGNKVGYTSIESGLFAGSMIIGSTIGSLIGGIVTKKLDYRKSFFTIGLVCLIGAVMTHVATGIFQYWLLFVARIIVGFGMGWQAVASPHYADKYAPTEQAKTIGSLFQCCVSFFIFVASVFGICLGQTIGYHSDSNENLMGRMQGLVAPSTLLSILVMLLPLMTRDGYSLMEGDSYEDSADGAAPKKAAKTYSIASMIGPILNGVAMAAVCQLTGINANMNFAPTIMSNLGIEALVGNIIVMAWNSLATFCVIPLSRRFTMRTLFLFCGIVGSLCCVFLSGIPVYPGVTKSEKAVNGIAIAGIAIFIALYEMGVGPCFYVLAVDVFPESFRPIGSSITVGVMMAFNLVINICYPIATEGMSGGSSGNQNKGQAIAFIFFDCVGIVTVVIEYFFLHPWEENSAADRDESGNSLENEKELIEGEVIA